MLVVGLTVLATGLLAAPQASAGAWEETLLDPPPARIEAGLTYTFGYWILQHGSYPYMGGDLGPTALRATDEKGQVVDFPGTKTVTDGHYSAEVIFPHDGDWTISSQHEVLMPDTNVAMVTVPGGVRIAPSDMRSRAPYKWGNIHPQFPPAAADAQLGAPEAPPSATALVDPPRVAPRSQQASTETPGTGLPMWLVVVAGAVTVGFAVWLGRRRARG